MAIKSNSPICQSAARINPDRNGTRSVRDQGIKRPGRATPRRQYSRRQGTPAWARDWDRKHGEPYQL